MLFKSISNLFFLADTLRTRLQELRKRRIDLEKLRDEVIKRLKHVHQKITSRRKDGNFPDVFFLFLKISSFIFQLVVCGRKNIFKKRKKLQQ